MFYATIISVLALGGVLGGLSAAPLSNRFGRYVPRKDDQICCDDLILFRKTSLLLNNIPAMIGSILMVSSKFLDSFEVLLMGRILVGFSVGL